MKLNSNMALVFGIILMIEATIFGCFPSHDKPFTSADGIFCLSQLFLGIFCITKQNNE